jgi:predicted GNAT family acetyltransferase
MTGLVIGRGCDDGWVSDPSQVTDNQAESRFELNKDGQRAELLYRQRGNRLVLIHTETPEELEGQGIGGALVTAAIDRAARDGLTVVPLCPFARGWLERHPDVASRVTIDWG